MHIQTGSLSVTQRADAIEQLSRNKVEVKQLQKVGNFSKVEAFQGLSLKKLWSLLKFKGNSLRTLSLVKGKSKQILCKTGSPVKAKKAGSAHTLQKTTTKPETFTVSIESTSGTKAIQVDKRILPILKGTSSEEIQRAVTNEIQKGTQLLRKLSQGERVESSKENLFAFFWAAQALQEKEVGFSSGGTAVLSDPNKTFADFLLGCQEKYSRTFRVFGKNLGSTHFPHFNKDDQFGLDFKGCVENGHFSLHKGNQRILPNNKGTVLMGALTTSKENHLKTPCCFFKLEAYGTPPPTSLQAIQETIQHGNQLLIKKSPLKYFLDTHSINSRKEHHIDKSIKGPYKDWCKTQGEKVISPLTVRAIFQHLTTAYDAEKSSTGKAKANTVLAHLKKTYPEETLSFREGHEVCLTQKSIQKFVA